MKIGNGVKDNRRAVALVADDDEFCLDVIVQMLTRLGFTVIKAKDGKEAVDLFKKHQNVITIVILDMKMPYNGGKTFRQLRLIDNNVKVLIASGWNEDYQIRSIMAQGCNGFLSKPFNLSMLSEKIQAIMDT